MTTTGKNVYVFGDEDTNDTEVRSPTRSRHDSGSTHRSSIISGFREFVSRQRSESVGNDRRYKKRQGIVNKNLIRVQVENCTVGSVYDIREEDEFNDVYNDSYAFRRPRSLSTDLLILRKTSRPLSVDVVGLVEQNKDPYRQYMNVVDCYEMAPHAGQLVVFDSSLKLERAIKALAECGSAAALVWSQKCQRVTSILTLTDLLLNLLSGSSPSKMTVQDAITANTLITLDASCKLLDACVEFSTSRVHRIVIREPTGDILYLLSTRRILQAVHKQHRSLGVSPWLGLKIRASGIGTWGNIHSVTTKDKLKNVVRLMIDFRISSIPVVDDGNKPIDVLCKADVALALHSVKNIEEQFATMNVDEMLSLRPSCEFLSDEDTVGTVLDTLLCGVSRRCIFLRQKTTEKLVACVSLSDLVSYIMFREGSENCSKSDDY